MINTLSYKVFAGSDVRYSARTVDLLGRSIVVDMLSDLDGLQLIRADEIGGNPFDLSGSQIQRILDSGTKVFHPAQGTADTDTYHKAIKLFSYLNGFIADNDGFIRIDEAVDFERTRGNGPVGILLGLQNSSHFRSASDVDLFYGLGQRVSQLTYNTQNLIGSGATSRHNGGISHFGVDIVKKMNQCGMAIDVSHCGDATTLESFEVSAQPVLITHSNCRVLAGGHPRCKTDEAIKAMAKLGGVMGITGVRNFVRHREPTTIEHFVDHIDHVRDLVGIEHVGIGTDSDIDGYDDLPEKYLSLLKSMYRETYEFRDKIDIEGIDHPKRMFDITEALIRRGYSDENIQQVLGENFKRALGSIWGPTHHG